MLLFFSGILLIPLVLALFEPEPEASCFIESSAICAICGLLMYLPTCRCKMLFSTREGFFVVTMSWVALAIFGGLPYMLYRENPLSFPDAFFETMSGFSTTGASILSDIEGMPRSLLLWRSFTHFLGGMGIIVLFLAILPAMGAGGFQLFRAEVPGPTKDKLSPKITNTAKMLWGVYVGLNLGCILCLVLVGMGPFDAINHSFAAIATGGFSTKNTSVAAFHNWKVEIVLTIFMYLAGCNFLHFINILRGKIKPIFKNEEWRFYTCSILLASAFIAIVNGYRNAEPHASPQRLALDALFTVTTLTTCTGFGTVDVDSWPQVCQLVVLCMMIMGACAGSTGGGMKVFRVVILLKSTIRDVAHMLHPRAILPLKMDGEHVQDDLLRMILGFVGLHLAVLGGFTLLLLCIEGDRFNILSIFSACVTCLSGVGPGLDKFGTTDNFSALSDASKMALSFLMLMGRLEIYSVLTFFSRKLWMR